MNDILVRLPQAVGDAIMATAMLRALRDYYPSATIDVAGGSAVGTLVSDLPYISNYLTVERGAKGRRVLATLLRTRSHVCALILPNSLVSVWPILAARIPRRVGYAKYPLRRLLLTDAIPVPYDEMGRFVPTPMHEYYLGLVRALGGPAGADPWPEVRLKEADRDRARVLREKHSLEAGSYIVLNPGAAFGTSKLWTQDGWAWLADALHSKTGARIVISGGPGEADHARGIITRMRTKAVDFATEPIGLASLFDVIAHAGIVVTLDSGPRHMAVAARRPIVCLMGPNDRRYTECCMDHTRIIQLAQLHCIACHYKDCPTAHECMRMLPRELVLETAMTQWNVRAS